MFCIWALNNKTVRKNKGRAELWVWRTSCVCQGLKPTPRLRLDLLPNSPLNRDILRPALLFTCLMAERSCPPLTCALFFSVSFLSFVCITRTALVWNNDSQSLFEAVRLLLGNKAAFAFLSFLSALNHVLPRDWVLACWPTFCLFGRKEHEGGISPFVLEGKLTRIPSCFGVFLWGRDPGLPLKNQEACRIPSQSEGGTGLESSFLNTCVNWQVVHQASASPSPSSLTLALRSQSGEGLLSTRYPSSPGGSTVGDQWLEGGLSCCRVLWHYN